MRIPSRYYRGTDPWGRGSFSIPGTAVIGSSDCGTYYDSPAPSGSVKAELARFGRVLRRVHIPTRTQFSRSGNVFMVKRWLCVPPADYERAAGLADKWLKKHDSDTWYVHSARN